MYSKNQQRFLNAASVLFALVGMVALAVSALVPELFELGLGTFVLAETVGGTVTYTETEDKAPGHLERDISTIVTEVKPDDFPLDTMLRRAKREETAKNVKVEFETVTFRKRRASVTTSMAGAGNADESAFVEVDNVNLFAEDDTVFLPGVTVGPDNEEFAGIVSAIDAANSQIKIYPTNNANVPLLTAGTDIVRGGVTKGETDAQTQAVQQLPIQEYNWCQTFMGQVEMSKIRKLVNAYSKYGYIDHTNQSIYDLRTGMEFDSLFGAKNKVWVPEKNDWRYTQDGVTRQINRVLNYTAGGLTWQNLIDWCKELFSGNAGSYDRIFFTGKDLTADIMKIDNVQKQIAGTDTKVVQGVEVSEIRTNFGKLMIKHHKLLDEAGLPGQGIVLDMMNIRRRVLEPMSKKKLNLDETGQKRVDALRILETFCMETRYKETHARVIPS